MWLWTWFYPTHLKRPEAGFGMHVSREQDLPSESQAVPVGFATMPGSVHLPSLALHLEGPAGAVQVHTCKPRLPACAAQRSREGAGGHRASSACVQACTCA